MDATAVPVPNEHNPPERFELEHFLPYWLSVLSNTVSQGIAQFYEREFGLTVPEWRVMAVLGRYPGLTASELCERTVMDKVTISRAVNALLERHYLERITAEDDRRKRPLRVAEPAGRKVLESVVPFALAYQKKLLAGLTAAELAAFREISTRLLAAATALNRGGLPAAAAPRAA